MTQTASSPLPLLLIAVMALVVLAAVALPENVPPLGQVTEHALKHGTELENALWERENGACVRSYRSPNLRRWIDLVGSPSALFLYGIVRSAAGNVVTGYYAPRIYWEGSVSGWTLYQMTGHCGP